LPPRVLSRLCHHAYWVSVIPLCRCPPYVAEATDGLDSEVFTLPPAPNSYESGSILSQALTPLQSITRAPPQAMRPAAAEPVIARPFRGFVPCSVFPAAWSHIHPTIPKPPVMLRPRGFSPPRRFAPRATYRAYFISNPLLGLTLQGFHPRAAPYVLPNAESLMGFRPRFRRSLARPSRVSGTPPEARTEELGFSQCPPSCAFLGSTSRGFL
jgi:hypothetical protein